MELSKKYLLLALFTYIFVSLTGCGGGDDTPPRTGIALFTSIDYVDYDAGNSDSEASNLEAGLISFNETVNTFTGITAADFTGNATSTTRALVIPELENGDLNADLDDAARTAIQDYVQQGGILIVFDPAYQELIDLLNTTFGWTLSFEFVDGTITLDATAASGTPFAGGPATLPDNNATDLLDINTLPAGATSFYNDDTNGHSGLAVLPVGSGHVVVFGWDWFDAAPVGTQDGGWLDVLDASLTL